VYDHCKRTHGSVPLIFGRLLGPMGLQWLHGLMTSNPNESHWTYMMLRTEFLRRFAGQVRPESATNFEKLMKGRVRMNDDSVDVYAERFNDVIRHVPHLGMNAQCQLYIRGLTRELQSKCCVDLHGNEWVDLDALIKHSYVESMRGSLAPRTDKTKDTPKKKFHKRKWHQQGRNQEESGPSGAADSNKRPRAALGATAAQKTPSKGKLFGVDSEGQEVFYNPPPNDFDSRTLPPVKQSKWYDCRPPAGSNELTKEQREGLKRDWICPLCRGTALNGQRHPFKMCPKYRASNDKSKK
jgi:Retrotransposon gag protein